MNVFSDTFRPPFEIFHVFFSNFTYFFKFQVFFSNFTYFFQISSICKYLKSRICALGELHQRMQFLPIFHLNQIWIIYSTIIWFFGKNTKDWLKLHFDATPLGHKYINSRISQWKKYLEFEKKYVEFEKNTWNFKKIRGIWKKIRLIWRKYLKKNQKIRSFFCINRKMK